MKKILLQLLLLTCTLNMMAQRAKSNDKDGYLNQTTLTVTKAGTLEQVFAETNPDSYQGLRIIGPLRSICVSWRS
mgnify:CR=1 FL=1